MTSEEARSRLAALGLDDPAVGVLVATLVYTAVASSTVVVPVVAAALFPARVEPWLVAAREWLRNYAAAIGAGFLILVGGLLIGTSLTG